MNLIESKDLTLAYDGKVVAENVNFKLGEGDYLCVLGENGSGKSTLLRVLTGEIKPLSGELILSEKLRKSGIGYLSQQSKIQRDFPASVEEVVLSGCVRHDRLGVVWSKESKKKAREAMDMLDIAEIGKKCFGELSGGQKQRVLLARAVCASDMLLLLDEPVTGLDPTAAHEMYAAIRKINRERGVAVMMVSHDVHCALREAENVLSMCRGHSFYGTVEEYAEHERLDDLKDRDLHEHHHNNHSHNHTYPHGHQ